MDSTILIIGFIALAVAVFISIKFKVNVGIVTCTFAFLIGGFGLGLSVNTIVSYFPVSLFFTLLSITLFYGFAVSNGTIQKIADYAVYLCRNRAALVPWAIFAVAFVVCALGCPPPGIGAVLTALSVAVQKRTNMNYYLAVSVPTFGAMGGGFMPYGLFYTIIKGLIISVGGVESDVAATMMTKISLFMVIFELLCAIAVYVWAKGYRLKKLEFAKPAAFNKKQKTTLILIICVMALLLIPAVLKLFVPAISTFTNYVTIVSLSCIGACVCSALKLADEKEVIKNNIPWSLLIMIVGAVMFINVLDQAGLTSVLSGLFSESMTGRTAAIMFCLVAGLLSFFVDSTGVVLPLFIPLAFSVAGDGSVGIAALYIAALCAGSYAAGNCPLSTGGSLMLSQSDDANRQKLFYWAWIGSFATLAIAIIQTFIGSFLTW